MKAVLNGQYNGSGGASYICIKGDLNIEGLNIEALQVKLNQLEAQVIHLQNVVSRLQEQNMVFVAKELAKALEELKKEQIAAVTVDVPSVVTVEPAIVPEVTTEPVNKPEPVVSASVVSTKKKTSSTKAT